MAELFNEAEERAVVKNMLRIAKRPGATTAPAAISAASWLWDRKYGKPTQRSEVTGAHGTPLIPFDYATVATEIASGSGDDSNAPESDPGAGDG